LVAGGRARAVRAGAPLVIRIGTRGSVLALAQAALVRAGLGGDAEIVPMRTEGDRLAEARLAANGGTGPVGRGVEDRPPHGPSARTSPAWAPRARRPWPRTPGSTAPPCA